jgi:hypothetical protein
LEIHRQLDPTKIELVAKEGNVGVMHDDQPIPGGGMNQEDIRVEGTPASSEPARGWTLEVPVGELDLIHQI